MHVCIYLSIYLSIKASDVALIPALPFGRDRVLRAPFFTLARARVARLFLASRPLLIAALAFGRDRVLRAPFFTLARARVARLFFAGRPVLGKPREPTRLRCGRDVFKVVRACLSIYLSLSRSLSLSVAVLAQGSGAPFPCPALSGVASGDAALTAQTRC